MSTSSRQRLEQDRRELLDLGLRNTLLNFRELKGRGARVVDELSEQVYKILVERGRAMSLLSAPDPEPGHGLVLDDADDEYLFAQPEEEEDGLAARHTDDHLQTPYSDPVLQRRLLNSYHLARTHLEERGVNVLYLALGMLHWFESPDSQDVRCAPIILVPVSLDRRSASSRFKVSHNGGDIGTNICLGVKLKAEFGIDLPELPDEDELDVPGYISRVTEAVSDMERWWVHPNEIHLGFFAFTKLLMYEDLDPQRWPEDHKPYDHELLRAVLEEGFGSEAAIPDEHERLDEKIDPESLYQVVDADSSQTLAIQRVLEGRNMVIQGPPGTGKSQTITNLIAESVAAGKKVLFVAEKMAALGVVKRKLESIGLDDCCIEIHSHNTNKRDFVAELGRTLGLGTPTGDDRSKLAGALRESRDRLNAYARAVNEPIGSTGVNPYRAYGRLILAQAALEGLEPPKVDRVTLPAEEWTPEDIDRREAILRELGRLLEQTGPLQEHPFWGSTAEVFVPTLDAPEIEEATSETLTALEACEQAFGALSTLLDLPVPRTADEAVRLLACARRLVEAPDLNGVAIASSDWTEKEREVRKAIDAGEKRAEVRAAFEANLLPHAWSSEVVHLRNAIAMYGGKWWRLLSSAYRRSRRELGALWQGPPLRGHEDQLKTLDAILLVGRLEKDLERLSGLLSELYGKPLDLDDQDWRSLRRISEYLNQIHRELAERNLPPSMLQLLATERSDGSLRSALTAAEEALETYRTALVRARTAVKLPEPDLTAADEEDFGRRKTILAAWKLEPGRLQEIASFNQLAKEVEGHGLAFLLPAIATWPHADRGILDLFRRTYYAGLLERAQRERPVLASFEGSRHRAVLEEFRSADRRLLQSNRLAVAHCHWEGLPSLTDVGQVGVLMHEINKKRRHRPIRRLMLDAGRAIQAIKPVFMMSPLSIASFIPPGSAEFDLVVFDEASQVRPVDAYGALLRGSQAVVVGDSKQLPPTSFFDTVLEEVVDDEEEEIQDRASDVESILALFSSRGAYPAMLTWHYRSRHESLIAVSNLEFYDNKLTVYPSPDGGRETLGLVYHHLPETHYERGRGRSYNRGEAQVVARAVMRHARERPDLTLGVAAFSMSQMDVILDAIELLRRQDPSCESFFTAHSHEPFFVKNLENVQGDERDVIFISIGYGKTAEGYLAMNFGPLNRDGGERRLNVLITRARRRCEVFTNLKADDIDLNRARGPGIVALKRYLRYAEHGILDVPIATGGEADSEFEEAVAYALRQHGYTVEHQVGSAGFFIDLAIVDPDKPGRYLLGIECDGATYHRARWARDRDRLRQEILEGLGWTIHRIWSTDWFYNGERELRRVLESIERARTRSGGAARRSPEPEPPEKGHFSVPRREIEVDIETAQDELLLAPYVVATLQISLGFHELFEISAARIAAWVVEVVEVESPVHTREVTSRLAHAAGYNRSGNRIRAAVERGIRHAVRKGMVRLDSERFLWAPTMKAAVPRSRFDLPVNSRKLELISPAEIELLLVQQAEQSHGAAERELISAVCRQLGFGRVSAAMGAHVKRSIRSLLERRELVQQGEVLMAQRDQEEGRSN